MSQDREVWQSLMGGDARTLAAALGLTVAVRDIVERLDDRPVPPQGIVGNPDKGRHGVTNIVELNREV